MINVTYMREKSIVEERVYLEDLAKWLRQNGKRLGDHWRHDPETIEEYLKWKHPV
jgi:hypothetical protein